MISRSGLPAGWSRATVASVYQPASFPPARAALPAPACRGAGAPARWLHFGSSWLSPSRKSSTLGPSRQAECCSGPTRAVRFSLSWPIHRPPSRPSRPQRSRHAGAQDCHVRKKHRPRRPFLQRRQGEEARCWGKESQHRFQAETRGYVCFRCSPGEGTPHGLGRGAGDAAVHGVV